MRNICTVCLLACVLWLSACSYSTNFVVINASNQSVEIQYVLKKPIQPIPPIPPIPPDKVLRMVPAIKAVSEVNQQIAWRELSASQYTFDPDERKVVVLLNPGEALRIEQCGQLDREVDDAQQAAQFSVEALDITGINGEIKLQGDQVRKSFVAESKSTYTLTYH